MLKKGSISRLFDWADLWSCKLPGNKFVIYLALLLPVLALLFGACNGGGGGGGGSHP